MNNIVIEVDGGRFDGWEHVSVSKSIENLCGHFSFIGTASKLTEFPVKVGQECQIFVNDVLFMTAWVEKIDIELSAFNHVITISGRDITNDVVDSQLGHIDFNPNTNLKSMTEKVLQLLNLNNIKVIDNFNLKNFTDIETDALGMPAFKFLESYAKKRQVLLSTNGEGDIVFIRAGFTVNNTVLSMKEDTAATLLKAHVAYDDSKRFNEYECIGQQNTGSGADFITKKSPKDASSIEAKIFDNEIRDSRKYVFQPEENGTTGDNEGRALWEANYRKSNAMIYNATVQGFKPLSDDGLWDLNTLVQVVDDFSNIGDTQSILLITEIEYIEDLNEGTITNLKLMNRESFTTIVNQPEKDKKDFNEGRDFIARKQTGGKS